MEQLVYQGWAIEPDTRSLSDGGFSGKVRLRERGAPTAAGVVWLTGRWETKEEARRNAVLAGIRLIDAGVLRKVSPP